MKSFEVIQGREFGDGTGQYEVRFIETMTVQELIDYATYRSSDWGFIEIDGNKVLEYRYGVVLTDRLTDEQKKQTISRMQIFGGYRRADYIIELSSPVNNDEESWMNGYKAGASDERKNWTALVYRLCEAILFDWKNKEEFARETALKLKENEK